MPCSSAQISESGKNVICSVITSLVGMECGHPAAHCASCRHAEGDDSFVRLIAKKHIRNLLVSGNQPRFADTVDVPAMAARFRPISTKEEREEVVRKAVECQCIPQEEGGHNATTVAENLEELERELGMEEFLETVL